MTAKRRTAPGPGLFAGAQARAPAGQPRQRWQTRAAEGWRVLLLDPMQADYMCRAVRVAINNLVLGEPSLLHVYLRAELIQQVDAYLAESWPSTDWRDATASGRGDVKACRALNELAEDIAEKIEDQYPFHEGAGDSYAQRLRAAWAAFIEHVAPSELIRNVAEVSSRNSVSAKKPRKLRVSHITGEPLTDEILLRKMSGAKGAPKKTTARKSLSKEYGVTPKTIDSDYKKALERSRKGK